MDVFLGQLLLVGFDFAPNGWASAAGQLLPISQNAALFSLLGVNYGGNGTTNFALPNLQGTCAIGYGNGLGLSSYAIGETGGTETVTLISGELPPHSHSIMAKSLPPTQESPTGNVLGESLNTGNLYSSLSSPQQAMAAGALGSALGGSQPHNNMMPYLAMNWIISMSGIYPQRP